MKAFQLVRPRTFELVEVPVPTLSAGGPERLLIKTLWASLCGSDIPFFTGSKRHKSFPFPPGFPIHEVVGQVVQTTSEEFEPDNIVISIPEGNLALAEYFVAKASTAVQLPSDLGNSDVSCLIQPLSTVMNAVDRLGDIQGLSAAVVGLGSTGLFFCWLLKNRQVRRIIGIDPMQYRCILAKGLGADQAYPMRGIEAVKMVRHSLQEWELVDLCIEAVGHQMDTVNDCFELIRKRGTVVAFGVPDHNVYAIEYETFFRKNAILMATVTPDWKEYLGKARDLFLSCQDVLERWVTHRLPIREAQKAFSLYERQEEGIVKVVLDASEW